MKKLLLITMVFISINTWAQKIRVGFTTGVAISNYKVKVGGDNETGNTMAGFTAGILLDVPVGKHFSFQPAINFVQKGTKDETTFSGYKSTVKLNTNNLEMPLNFLYNSGGNKLNFFIGAGPSFSLGLSGKTKFSDGTNSASENIKFGSGDDDNMKPIDVGANFISGISFNNRLLFSLNYNAGLNNLIPHPENEASAKSHYFGIKLGYMLNFGKRK